jgi:prepilin-type processing-associated H-X9-DG protein
MSQPRNYQQPSPPVPVQPIYYQTPPQARPWDGLAIASLICGLLFFIPLLPAVIAIILAIVSLRRPAHERQGRGMAIAGLVLGCASLLLGAMAVAMLEPELKRRAAAQQISCMANMKQIGVAFAMYVNDNRDNVPPDLADAQKYLGQWGAAPSARTSVFICPACDPKTLAPAPPGGIQTSYVFLAKDFGGTRYSQIKFKSRTIVMYEALANHGGRGISVLYADWHVEKIDGSIAAKVIQEIKSGQNPPPSLGR